MKSILLRIPKGLATMTAATSRTAVPACPTPRTGAGSSPPQGGILSNLPARQRGVPPAAEAPPRRRHLAGRPNEAFHGHGGKTPWFIPGTGYFRETPRRSVPLPPKPIHPPTLARWHSTHAPDEGPAASPTRPRPGDRQATALIQAEMRLPGIYTTLVDPAAQERHGHHQEALAQALAELKARPRDDGLDFREIVAQELPGLLQKTGFDAGIYAARNSEVGGYGRYLLHSDPDPTGRFCLQIFAFEPRQKTPIHNHPNECASYIAQGALMERVYELPRQAADAGHAGQVAKLQKNERPQASWAGFDLTRLQVPHSLKNKSASLAVSVHLYRDMDGVSEGQQVAAAEKFERFRP